ncbi:CheW protein [Ferrithrix thermotolerans DSM 19514]|uniref:CheW protein n=1 Tax=Ferrithrix thermotolerans DSM 19514 TaxID=1121881 RepID=A0A1M4U0B6_9ACTN|nr:chemotaxis protein CheW [Ferrithrix thermotolerans]SHE50026.1 CheW protein [Ferrithrix thermotolerans DSM 19514]
MKTLTPLAASQYCSFRLGDLFLGISVEAVQEVIRTQVMTKVPLSDPCVSGLVNLRGQIVTALSLRRRFGMEPKYPKPPMNIVISNPDGAISLLVDEIGDVMTIEQDYFESVPETFDPRYKSLLEGVFKLDGSLLLLLNLEEAIRTSE